jgi:hypothetical protein
MMSGLPLETCWAFNERWNNKILLQGCILLVVSTESFLELFVPSVNYGTVKYELVKTIFKKI